jgi:hypothetical protein
MASTVTLDMADPATKALVDGWADNTEYTVTMTVRTGAGAKRNQLEVVGPVEETEPEPEVEEAPTESPGPAAVQQAMGSMGA